MLVFMVGVIVYKLLIYRPLAANPGTRGRAQQIANITGAFVNLTIIMILSRVSDHCVFSNIHTPNCNDLSFKSEKEKRANRN